MAKKTKDLFCDFCGKERHEVEKLIAGANVNICNECVKLCDRILVDQESKTEKKNKVQWVVQDIRNLKKEEVYDLWHDRALFHFLNSIYYLI